MKFHKTWVQALHQEYESICWHYKAPCIKPLIQIHTGQNRLGYWDPVRKTLSISQFLFEHFPWTVITEVLKHEMAHQIVMETWKLPESGHGAAFQQACTMLGVLPEFRRSEADLEALLETEKKAKETAAEDGIYFKIEKGQWGQESTLHPQVEKIKKLLSLSQSPNENEALSAMQKAVELSKRYAINLETLSGDPAIGPHSAQKEEPSFILIHHKTRRLPAQTHLICSILTSFFQVQVIFREYYSPPDQCYFKAFEILGKQSHVEVADYIYFFLLKKIKALSATIGGPYRRSYEIGILHGFYEKIEDEQRLKNQSTDNSLPPSDRARQALIRQGHELALREWVKMRYPRTSSQKTGAGGNIDRKIFEHGKNQGRDLTIVPGINQKNSKNQKFLS